MDGLDEAPELAGTIILQLRRLPKTVTVWIASRDIPAIRAIRSASGLATYMIAPLSMQNIVQMAEAAGVDGGRFLGAIQRKGIVATCAKPLGCSLAVSAFMEDGLQHSGQAELWDRGIRRLCDETGSWQRDLASTPRFLLDEVVDCCAWIALCMTLSGKTVLWTDRGPAAQRAAQLCRTYGGRGTPRSLSRQASCAVCSGRPATAAFATQIAVACRCTDLSGIFASRALGRSSALAERVRAARALHGLGDRAAKGRLKAVLPLDPADDPFDELRGYVLRCCWPDCTTPAELVASLVPPQRQSFLGSYGYFLDYELPETFGRALTEQAADVLLRWSTGLVASHEPLDRLGRLARRIYSFCWRWATKPELAALLADGYLSALECYHTPFAAGRDLSGPGEVCTPVIEDFARNREGRFVVLRALLRRDITEETLRLVPGNQHPLFGADGAEAMLDRILEDPTDPLASRWAACLKAVLWRVEVDGLSEQIDKLHRCRLDLMRSMPELREEARKHDAQWRESSETWKRQEEDWRKKRESEQRRIDQRARQMLAQKVASAESFAEIAVLLDSENGMLDAPSLDLMQSPGSAKLTPLERESLLDLAERYVREGDIEQTTANQFLLPAQAFTLLRLMRPESYQGLPIAVWERTARELLKASMAEYLPLVEPLFDTLAADLPEVAERALLEVIRDQLAQSGYVTILREWGSRLSERQSASVLRLAQDTALPARGRCTLLAELAAAGRQGEVLRHLDGLLAKSWCPHPEASLNGHVLLALCLDPGRYLPAAITAMEQDRDWGRQWVELAVADVRMSVSAAIAKCTPAEIASVYTWLHKEYPSNTRPDRQGVYSPGPLDMIHELKDSLLLRLVEQGAGGSAAALESIRAAFPSEHWLSDPTLDARRNEDAASVPTLSPLEIRALRGEGAAKRNVVKSAKDLRELLAGTLVEYQAYLTGDTPAVGDLWSDRPRRPRNEEYLSDHLRRFLGLKLGPGVVVNREVQIRRKLCGGGDIHGLHRGEVQLEPIREGRS